MSETNLPMSKAKKMSKDCDEVGYAPSMAGNMKYRWITVRHICLRCRKEGKSLIPRGTMGTTPKTLLTEDGTDPVMSD